MPDSSAIAGIKRILSSVSWVCLLWIGLDAGTTLVAIPAIFSTPGLERPDAVRAASSVFAAFDRAQMLMLILLLVTVRFSGHARRLLIPLLAVTLLVLAQSIWLLPELSVRADQIASGVTPPASAAHGIYSTLELCKIALLGFLILLERRIRRE